MGFELAESKTVLQLQSGPSKKLMEPINGKLELEQKVNDPIEYYALEIIPSDYLKNPCVCVYVKLCGFL